MPGAPFSAGTTSPESSAMTQRLSVLAACSALSVAFSSKVVPVDVASSDVDKAIKGAERVVESIRNKRFKPNRGEHCEKCDTREICRWRRDCGDQ